MKGTIKKKQDIIRTFPFKSLYAASFWRFFGPTKGGTPEDDLQTETFIGSFLVGTHTSSLGKKVLARKFFEPGHPTHQHGT